MDSFELSNSLNTWWLGKKLIHLDEIDSTNQEVKRIAENQPNGTIVIAEKQTRGKGRLGRVWCSDEGTSLLFSILLKPEIAPNKIAGITLACGFAVCKAIRNYTNLNALIKWPNDIIIGNKKLCGILTEMSASAEKINYAVVGIGVNVNTTEFDDEISGKATSLRIEKCALIDRAKLFGVIIEALEKCFDDYFSDPDNIITDDYKALCATINREVTIKRGSLSLTGTAIDIKSSGDLVVRLADNSVTEVSSGEVTVQGIY